MVSSDESHSQAATAPLEDQDAGFDEASTGCEMGMNPSQPEPVGWSQAVPGHHESGTGFPLAGPSLPMQGPTQLRGPQSQRLSDMQQAAEGVICLSPPHPSQPPQTPLSSEDSQVVDLCSPPRSVPQRLRPPPPPPSHAPLPRPLISAAAACPPMGRVHSQPAPACAADVSRQRQAMRSSAPAAAAAAWAGVGVAGDGACGHASSQQAGAGLRGNGGQGPGRPPKPGADRTASCGILSSQPSQSLSRLPVPRILPSTLQRNASVLTC